MKRTDEMEEFLDTYGVIMYAVTGIILAISLILSVCYGGAVLWCITTGLAVLALLEGMFRSFVYELEQEKQFVLAIIILIFVASVWIF